MVSSTIVHNSGGLQEAFPEVYRDFFSQSPLVVSAPRGFWWAGEYVELYGGLAITQKIPLRVYVGLEGIKQNTIEFGRYLCYSMRRRQFIRKQFNAVKERRLIAFLTKMLPSLLRSQRFSGVRIHILSELSFEHGLFSIGSLTAALATSLYFHYGLIDPATLEGWANRPTLDLRNDPRSRFNAIHLLAWKLETIVDTDWSSGSRAFSALVSGAGPMVYFTERRSGHATHHPHGRVPAKITTNQELLDGAVWWGYRIDEVTDGAVPDPWPVDIGLLFSGEEKSNDAVVRSLRTIKDQFDVTEDSLATDFDRLIPRGSPVEPFFLKPMDPEHRLELWAGYLAGFNTIALETLMCLKDIIRRGSSQGAVSALTQKLKAYQSLFEILNVVTPRTERIVTTMNDLSQRRDIEPFAIKCTGSGGGGNLLFLSSYGRFGDNIDDLLGELRKRVDNTVSLDYASWRDGTEDAGVRLEQMMSVERYSPFVSEGCVVARQWGAGLNGTLKLYSYEQFAKERVRFDFLLDLPEEHVSIRGQVLKSNEIHSAKATIDVLLKMLKASGTELPASAFGSSSYVDRNEMQSKIVTPLTRAFEKRLNKRLPFEVTGGLRKDFRVRFRSGRLNICVVEQRL